MFKIKGIDHIVLRTNNIEKMQTFYCEILGCTVEKVNKRFGLLHLRAGDQLIDLLNVNTPPTGKNLEHFCLRIEPFVYNEMEQYFQTHGIKTVRYDKRYNALGTNFSFYIQDPDGNEIEFIQAR